MKKLPLLALLSLLSLSSFGQTIDKSAIDQIFSDWDKDDVPGCALGIMQDGKIVYARGYGLANMEYDIPNSPNSVFRIASTSKQFTAACIVRLAEMGKLALDNPLSQFFPEFPDYAKEITISHLLNHTSGIRDYLVIADLKGFSGDDYYEDEDIMKWLINQRELNFKPGDEYLYSNSGYWLLGQIVNQVAEMNMADFAEKELFKPLGMSSTHFHNDHTRIVKNRATGYYPIDEESYQISMTTLGMIGDGGIFTTINDIKKWDDAFYDRSILSDAFWAMMTKQAVLNSGEVIEYASGLSVSEYKGLKTISHGGAFVGFRAEYMRFPEQHFAVAIFTNRGDANPTGMAYQVADLLLKDKFANNTNEESSNERASNSPQFIDLKTSALENFAGHYWSADRILARKIYVKNDTLRYYRSATNESSLLPVSPSEFRMINVGAEVIVKFYTREDGTKMMSFVANGGEPIISELYQPKEYAADELSPLLGKYYSKELDVTYKLKSEDESLVLYVNDTKAGSLDPIMKDLFAMGRSGIVQFNSNKDGNISGFRLAAGRVKNLLFEKE